MVPAPLQVVRSFVRQVNRHDADGLVRLLSPRHRFTDSLGHQVTGDRRRMRAMWAAYFRMVPDYRIELRDVLQQGARVVLTGTAAGSWVAPGAGRAAGRWRTPAAWRAVVRRGRLAEWQVYADNEPIRALIRRGGLGA